MYEVEPFQALDSREKENKQGELHIQPICTSGQFPDYVMGSRTQVEQRSSIELRM